MKKEKVAFGAKGDYYLSIFVSFPVFLYWDREKLKGRLEKDYHCEFTSGGAKQSQKLLFLSENQITSLLS